MKRSEKESVITPFARRERGVPSPEALFAAVWARVRPEWIACFVSALVCGLIAHAYKLLNWLPNWDSLVFRHNAQNMTHLGRWFLSIACLPSSYYDLPWVCGALAIFYVALAAVCVTALFRLRTKVAAALVGALLATFPTVTSTLTYCYVADGYALAFLLAVVSAMLFNARGLKNLILGVVALTLSLGIYQAYVSVTMTLLVVLQFEGLVFSRERALLSLRRAGRFLVGGVLAALVYMIVLRLILALTTTHLSDYLWAPDGACAFLDPHYPLCVFKSCVKKVFLFFVDVQGGLNLHTVMNALMLVSLGALVLRAAFHGRVFRSAVRVVLFFAYVAAAPICACPLFLLDPGTSYHNLMTMGFASAYVFFVLFYERPMFGRADFEQLKKWFVLVVGVFAVYDFTLISNIGYHKLQLAFLSSYGEAVRMANRIEETPGAERCKTLAVLGIKPDSAAWSTHIRLDLTGMTDGSLLRPDDHTVNQSVITATINDYCQKGFRFATIEERRALAKDPRVLKMPFWPERGSIAVIDGYVVLRLSAGSGLGDSPLPKPLPSAD